MYVCTVLYVCTEISPWVDIITGSQIFGASGLHVFLPRQSLEMPDNDRGSLGNWTRVALVQLPAVGERLLRKRLLWPTVFEYREVGVRPVGEYRTLCHGLDVLIHNARGESLDDETCATRFLSVGAHEHPRHADYGRVLLLLIHTYI